MIVVRVELVAGGAAGKVTELARAIISRAGGTLELGDYNVRTLRGRSAEALDRGEVQRTGKVLEHARNREHVWNLVAKALASCGYGPRRGK